MACSRRSLVQRSFIVAVAMVLAACSSSGAKKPSGGTTPAPAPGGSTSGSAAPANKGTIVVTNVDPLSGALAVSTTGISLSLKAAFAYFNSQGGVDGYTLKEVDEDDQGDTATSINDIRQLTESGKTLIYGDGVTSPALSPLETRGGAKFVQFVVVPFSQLADPKNFPDTFDVYPPTSIDLQKIADTAKAANQTKWAVIGDNTTLQAPYLAGIAAAAKSAGATIVNKQTVDPTATDFSSVAQAVQSSHADAIMLFTIGPDIARIIQALDSAGVKTDIYGTAGISASDLTEAPASALANQVTFTCPEGEGLQNGQPFPAYLGMAKQLQVLAKGTHTSFTVGFIFDVAYLMRYAIETAGGTDPTKMRQALESVPAGKSVVPGAPEVKFGFSSTNHQGYAASGYKMCRPIPSKTWPGFFPVAS